MLMGSGFYSGVFTNSKLLEEYCSNCEQDVESEDVYYDDYQDHYILCPSCGEAIELKGDPWDD